MIKQEKEDGMLIVDDTIEKKPHTKESKLKTKKEKRKATVTKNELTRNQLKICQQNQLKYKYVLADNWFSSKEKMIFICHDLEKYFIMVLKSNRTRAKSEKDKQQSCCIAILIVMRYKFKPLSNSSNT